jgi:hypothetical protein
MKPRETLSPPLAFFNIYYLIFECFCPKNEVLPKKEGTAASSKAACPHPPIPASPEAQERVK